MSCLRDVTCRTRPQPPTTVIAEARERPGSCPFSGVMMGSKMASAGRVVQVTRFGRLSVPRVVGMVLTVPKALGRKGGDSDRGPEWGQRHRPGVYVRIGP